MKFKTIILFIFFLGVSNMLNAQEEYNSMKKGINYLNQKNYAEAEVVFRKLIAKNDTLKEAYFNLGNALYEQKRAEEAREYYQKCTKLFKEKTDLAEIHHNIGNSYMQEKKWTEIIQAFKQALKNNPSDMDTKYNLAYAQKMLEKEKQQPQQKKPEEKQDQKQNQDKQEQDKKDQENKDKNQGEKDQGEKDQDKQDKNEANDKPKNGEEGQEKRQPEQMKLNKEEADRLLKAIEKEEQKLQDKKRQEAIQTNPRSTEKDW